MYLAQSLLDMHRQFSGDFINFLTWTYFVNSFTKVIIHFLHRGLMILVSISMKGVSIFVYFALTKG